MVAGRGQANSASSGISTDVSACQPWGLDLDQVAAIQAAVTTLNAGPMPKSLAHR